VSYIVRTGYSYFQVLFLFSAVVHTWSMFVGTSLSAQKACHLRGD